MEGHDGTRGGGDKGIISDTLVRQIAHLRKQEKTNLRPAHQKLQCCIVQLCSDIILPGE